MAEDPDRIRRHLNAAGDNYLNSINGTTPESLLVTMDKLKLIKLFAPNGGSILSVGVGQGEEIHALSELFADTDSQIIGIDIADSAVQRAAERVRNNEISAALITGNAAALPFRSGSLQGIVLSAVLHEVFSYHVNAREMWAMTVAESARTLSEGGVILLRDFAAPDLKDNVRLAINNGLPRAFYNYFAREFRAFTSWGDEGEGIRRSSDASRVPYPSLEDKDEAVQLPLWQVGELVLHYRNFWSDMQKGVTRVGDIQWKELNEMYYLPDDTNTALSVDEYTHLVVETANKVILPDGFELVPVTRVIGNRPETSEFLSRHFKISFPDQRPDQQTTLDFTQQLTNKMEIIFRKQRVRR